MSDYVSNIKTIPAPQSAVYTRLSDLRGLEKAKEFIPSEHAGKVEIEVIDSDTCAFSVPMAGKLTLQIVDREPEKVVKMEGQNTPLPITIWLQLVPSSEQSTALRVTLRTELNFMMRKMIGNKLQEAVEKLADMLTTIPYH